jgi:hypothetical protein
MDVSIGFAILVIGLLWLIPVLRLVALGVVIWLAWQFMNSPVGPHGW